METKADESGATTETAAVEKTSKSIIDPKYRGKYKTQDWLGEFIGSQISITKVLPAQAASDAVGEIGKEGYKPAKEAKPERTVVEGLDIDKLFELGSKNGLDLSKFQTQRGSHGFDGRLRMTVRNMLQPVAKQRHGLWDLGGTFVVAPDDWLHAKSAPAEATHAQDGAKIAKAKPAVAEKPAEESKLIKAGETTGQPSITPGADEVAKPTAKATAKKKK